MTLKSTDKRPPGAPVQVVMPAGLLARLPQMLAVLGLRLYQLPTKDAPTLLIAADMTELGGDSPLRSSAALMEAWDLGVASLNEPVLEKPVKRQRKRTAAARPSPAPPLKGPDR